MATLESHLERKVTDYCNRFRCMCLKLVAVGLYGFPDRTVICPGSRIFFVELKQEGKKAKKRQEWWHRTLTRYGFKVYVVDSFDQFKEILKEFLDDMGT